MSSWRLAAVAVLVGALGAGCAAGSKPVALDSRASEKPKAQLVLKPASGNPIVKFEGLVNGGTPIAADLASFDALPPQRLTIVEPFLKKTMTFTGVDFLDLLTAAKTTGTSVTFHALDDYTSTLKVAQLREGGVLLATRANGKVIDVKSGGPVRLVFGPSSNAGKNMDHWVWSIDQITIK